MSERSQRWFSPKFTFDLLLPEEGTLGLASGNGVYVLGIEAGKVHEIHVGDDGRIKAKVRLHADFKRFVRRDSVASIKKTFGVAGDSFVEIARGHGPPLPQQSPAIPCVSSEELPSMMESLLDELRQQIVPVLQKGGQTLESWTGLATNINQTQIDLRQVIARLDRLASGLEAGKGPAGQLLTNDSLAEDLQSVIRDARRLIDTGQSSLEQFRSAMQSLREGTTHLPQVGEALAAESKDLAGLVFQTQKTLLELERLITGLQRHWLVRPYIQPAGPSHDRIPPSHLQGGTP